MLSVKTPMPIIRITTVAVMLAALCAGLSSCSKSKVEIDPCDPDILYMGRILFTDSTAPTFTYPGTTAMLAFKGTGIAMTASPGSGQFMVEIDSMPPFKINFTESDSVIMLADSLSQGEHLLRVTYAIEGYEKHPEFCGFTVTGEDAALLPAPARPALKMEFIGNSITCGYGSEETDPQKHFSYDSENHTLGFAYLTARALNADFNIVARSGIGMYRSYGGPVEGTPDQRMPLEYDRTLIYNPGHYWNHSSFHPDIICINLGTNDTSLDTYDITLYEQAYRKFVAHLRMLHPDAKIVMLTGSMLHGQALADVKAALDRINADYPGTYRFDMSEQTGELGYGADYHPSRAQAARNAAELTEYLRSIL